MRTLSTFLNIRNAEIVKALQLYQTHNIITEYSNLSFAHDLRNIAKKVVNQCSSSNSEVFMFTPIGDKLSGNSLKRNLTPEKLTIFNKYEHNLNEIMYYGSWIDNYNRYYEFEVKSDNTKIITYLRGNGTNYYMKFSKPHLTIDDIANLVIRQYILKVAPTSFLVSKERLK